jgi:hypothetical protein
MRLRYKYLAILFLILIAGCEGEITGIVVDAETGQPIEGAIVLVEWTKAKGLPGMSYTESYKVVEAVTDKEGKASIEGVSSPLVSAPRVTVYKKGYVAWNNAFIFPDWKKRTDFKWGNNYLFKLEKFKPEYSFDKHISFIRASIGMTLDQKKIMYNAIRWEDLKASEEMREKGKK